MAKHTAEVYNRGALHRLKQEIADMERDTIGAIEALELQLHDLNTGDLMPEDGWSSRLDHIDIYTMEELPPLEKSIRKLTCISA